MSEKVLIGREKLDKIAFKIEDLADKLYKIAMELDEAWAAKEAKKK